MKNYEYKFVEVPTSENGKEANAPLKICAQIITAESKGGWRLKQLSDYSGKRSRLNNFVPVNYKLPL